MAAPGFMSRRARFSWAGTLDHSPVSAVALRSLRAVAVVALLLGGASPGLAGSLQGQAVLRPPFPLPADAVLDVQLIELIGSQGSTVLRGRSRSTVRGRTPYAFTVPYIDAAILPAGRYRLRATIRQADRLMFSTVQAVPVLNGLPPPVALVLEPVGDAPLRGLSWLRAPAASVPAPPGAPRQEQQFRLDPLSRELTGSGDCNRFIGSFVLQGDRLRLEPAGGTRLDCEPEVSADEDRFLAELLRVRRWRLDGQGRLELLDEAGERLLLMEARPL